MNARSDIYNRIREIRMSEPERRRAIESIRTAESMVEALLWVKSKLAAVGTYFLKPSLKH
jgi:hypothetical protein